MSLTLLVVFIVLAVLGVPLAVALGLGTLSVLWLFDLPLSMITQRMATSINSFLLIAVPLFIMAGLIMERGGLSERIFDAAQSVIGRFRGGLGQVNIASSFVFGGISGSSVADIASLGPITIRSMTSRGYPLPYSAALTMITATLATLVPPSILIIIAASAAGLSVGGALAGGWDRASCWRWRWRSTTTGCRAATAMARAWRSIAGRRRARCCGPRPRSARRSSS